MSASDAYRAASSQRAMGVLPSRRYGIENHAFFWRSSDTDTPPMATSKRSSARSPIRVAQVVGTTCSLTPSDFARSEARAMSRPMKAPVGPLRYVKGL